MSRTGKSVLKEMSDKKQRGLNFLSP